MFAVKNRFGKMGGNIAYHGYQSFKPGEITPEQAHQIGVELATRLWDDKFQVLVATHLDKEHIHNHLVLNSVSFKDGKKFNDNKNAYFEMRRISDELCKDYGLSVIQSPKGHTPRSIYFAEKNGEPTKYNLMRDAIDFAISISINSQNFIEAMNKQGYILEKLSGYKYPTIRSKNDTKPARLYHLGDEYSLEKIVDRVLQNDLSVQKQYNEYMYPAKYGKPFQPKEWVQYEFDSLKYKSFVEIIFMIFFELLGLTPQENYQRPLSPEVRREMRKHQRYASQLKLFGEEKFKTKSDVETYIDFKQKNIMVLEARRSKIYNKLRRCTDETQRVALFSERNDCTMALTPLRKKLKTAITIRDDISKVEMCIKIEQQMQLNLQEKQQQISQKDKGNER